MTTTLLSAWEATVRAAPDAIVITDAAANRQFTRGELDAAASAWCDAHGAGLSRFAVVLAEPNGPDWFRIFLGLLKADAIIVPLDPGEPVAAQVATASAVRAHRLWSQGALQPIWTGPRVRDNRRIVKLTSGSTGIPRALAFTDAQMLADGRHICEGMSIGATDVNFGLVPFGHSYGLGNLVVPLLLQGTAIVCGAAAFPHAMSQAVAQWQPTVFPAVPALLRALAMSDVPAVHLASLRTVISAGAPLAPEVAQAFQVRFRLKIHSFYGSSETGGITYDLTGDAAASGRSVGTPLPGVQLHWHRARRFSVESAAVFTLGNRLRSAAGLGLHHPADLGALTPDGELGLLGRAGRFVKIAGRRVNLAEVEHVLKALPGVRDAYVSAHPERTDALAAAVHTDVAAEAIRNGLRAQLAAWKIPKKIVALPTFPLTARGKTDTAQLRRLLGV
jgi:acyl-coenzyme A synthetase/AMP-(fatty) acid ligase